jgi:hypothetical protein
VVEEFSNIATLVAVRTNATRNTHGRMNEPTNQQNEQTNLCVSAFGLDWLFGGSGDVRTGGRLVPFLFLVRVCASTVGTIASNESSPSTHTPVIDLKLKHQTHTYRMSTHPTHTHTQAFKADTAGRAGLKPGAYKFSDDVIKVSWRPPSVRQSGCVSATCDPCVGAGVDARMRVFVD